MKKNFIRLNINDNYLSFGNFFRILKEESNNSASFWQADLFSIIFNTDSIADSTVNNYCTGFRAINSTYKNYIKNLKSKYIQNPNALLHIFSEILKLIDINVPAKITINIFNTNEKMRHICTRLYSISKNDSDITTNLSNRLHSNLANNDLYNFIAEVLFYTVLDKKQPIYIDENLNTIIEKKIYDTNISVNDIEDFMIKKRFQNNISEKNTDYKSLKFNNNLIINTTDDKKYDNKYEAEIQNRGNNNNYKIININVANNKGWLVVVYDPSTVHIMKSKAFKLRTMMVKKTF